VLPPVTDQDVNEVLDLLTFGELEVEGQLVHASNLALRAHLRLDGVEARVMYKPVSGERSLWDFPDGTLAGREAAAFVVSAVGGWNLVPPTVLRDGPFGAGTVQLWVDEGDGETLIDVLPPAQVRPGWLPVFEAELSDGTGVVVVHADRPDLASAAVYDAVTNNADRKGSHLVLDQRGVLRGFDHGISFNVEPKLRTVLWGWMGKPLPDVELARLEALAGWLAQERSPISRALEPLLTRVEVRALRRRIRDLLETGRFPEPSRHWPAVPWPPL